MPVLTDVAAPWTQALGPAQHSLILYSLVVAGLAMFAQFVRTLTSTGEVSPRYRSALYASLCITGATSLAYVRVVVKFDQAYVLDAASGRYLPNAEAITTFVSRYMDWSVTVPLLIVEFLAVGALVGARARSKRFVLMAAAFLMIFTGYLGAAVVGSGESTAALLIWGVISTAFFVYLYIALIGVLRSSRGAMGGEAYASYRNAAVLLLSVWAVYPLGYTIHNWLVGPEWTTTIQVGYSFADIAAKVGFGTLIHKVAKLRTAEDVRAGVDTHPEAVWVSSVKHSDGVSPLLKGMIEEPSFLRHGDGDGRRPAPREQVGARAVAGTATQDRTTTRVPTGEQR